MEQARNTSSMGTTEIATTMILTTVQLDIDWEHINDLDEQEARDNAGFSTLVLASIDGAPIAVGLTIVYGIYQLYTPSDATMYSNVTSVVP